MFHFLRFCSIPLLVSCYNSVPPSTKPGKHQCIKELCWTDPKGSGFIAGEPLTGYITPDTTILSQKDFDSLNRTGDIILFFENGRFQLESAVLGATILLHLNENGDTFLRTITNSAGKDIGYMNMKRPVPDPDNLFRDLAQDRLLNTFPEGLRSVMDPASFIPPIPNETCETRPKDGPRKCFLIIPSADVFYSGPEPTNTACLSAVASPLPTSAAPSPASAPLAMDPSSVYVVYQPPQIFDECRKWIGGVVGSPVTKSYPSGVLSSLQYQSNASPATKTIDFADLPCPPSEVAEAYNPSTPYLPVLKSEFGVRFNPRFFEMGDGRSVLVDQECVVAAVRDPPVHARRVGRIMGPKDGGDTIA
ncbi:MAG: hypothetical protein Q9226_002442 [Calogaya cf. arnoldii]